MSSETRPPLSITFFAASPSGVPAFTAARSMSPVEICGMPNASVMKAACVPLPAPGGPSRISRMIVALSGGRARRGCRPVVPSAPCLATSRSSLSSRPDSRRSRRGRSNCAHAGRSRVQRPHALEVLGRVDAGRRRACGDLDDDPVAVPERAQLLERLEALDRRRRQRRKRAQEARRGRRRGRSGGRSAGPRAGSRAARARAANASRAQGIVARLK